MPEEYSSSSTRSTGGLDFISPARSQQSCAACVGFAATAAAEAAVAISTRQNWQDFPGLSEANVSFCGGITPPVTCSSGSSFDALLQGTGQGKFHRWASRDSLPFKGASSKPQCLPTQDALPAGGALSIVDGGNSLDAIARVKEAIVLHGGVMTAMSVWSDFKTYPWSVQNSSTDAQKTFIIYNTTRPPAEDSLKPENLHAVFCFGWKDVLAADEAAFQSSSMLGFLQCKNSWGKKWGLNGMFNIAYGAANNMQPDSTYAFRFDRNGRAQDAVELLNNHSMRVTDAAYPACWLFSPPRPMRLLHVAEELDRISTSLMASSSAREDAAAPPSQRASSATMAVAGAQQQPVSKVQILQDLIVSNMLYTGLGTPAKVLMASDAQDPAAGGSNTLLTALIGGLGGTPAATDGARPTSFLICNSTAGLIMGRQQLQCPAGTELNQVTGKCLVCPQDQFRSVEADSASEACVLCPPGTGTLPSTFQSDHDAISDCTTLATEGPQDVLLEVGRTSLSGLARGPPFVSNWFELKCPAGRFITEVAAQACIILEQLSAICNDNTQLKPGAAPSANTGAAGNDTNGTQPQQLGSWGPTDHITFTVNSSTGFIAIVTHRSSTGLHSLKFLLPESTVAELWRSPAPDVVTTEVQLPCNGSTSERLIGFFGGTTMRNGSEVVAALGAICGDQVGVSVQYQEQFRTAPAGNHNKGGLSTPFETKCTSNAFLTSIKGWSRNNQVEGLRVACGGDIELPVFGAGPNGSAVKAQSDGGFTNVTAYVASAGQKSIVKHQGHQGQNKQKEPASPYVAGLAALDAQKDYEAPLPSIGASRGNETGIAWPPSCAGAQLGSTCEGTCAGGPVYILPRLKDNLCLMYESTALGTAVSLQSCSVPAGRLWVMPSDGTIRPATDSSKCLDAVSNQRVPNRMAIRL
eukprot:gene5129-5369_t